MMPTPTARAYFSVPDVVGEIRTIMFQIQFMDIRIQLCQIDAVRRQTKSFQIHLTNVRLILDQTEAVKMYRYRHNFR